MTEICRCDHDLGMHSIAGCSGPASRWIFDASSVMGGFTVRPEISACNCLHFVPFDFKLYEDVA